MTLPLQIGVGSESATALYGGRAEPSELLGASRTTVLQLSHHADQSLLAPRSAPASLRQAEKDYPS